MLACDMVKLTDKVEVHYSLLKIVKILALDKCILWFHVI